LAVIKEILDGILGWFIDLLRDTSLSLMEGLIASGLLVLPPWVTNTAEVISGRMRVAVVTCYALVVCIGALMIMGSDNLQFTYSTREIIPRLVAGFALSLMSWEIIKTFETVNNSIVISLLLGDNSEPVPGDAASVSDALNVLMLSYDLTQIVFIELVVELLKIIVMIMLFICMFTRNIAWFMVCLLAPIGLAAHGLPFTEGAAFLWWRMTFACMASSLGQAWVLWAWDSLFQGLTDEEVLLNYPLKGVYALVLVWLIWRIHKAAFLWARGRPMRIPGGRLIKGVATALIVGAVMKSNPVGALATRVPGIAKVAGRFTRFTTQKAAGKKAGQQAASPPGDYRSDKPWRMRSNADGPNGSTKLHTHGPGHASCPHCKPAKKRGPKPQGQNGSQTPQRQQQRGGGPGGQPAKGRPRKGNGSNPKVGNQSPTGRKPQSVGNKPQGQPPRNAAPPQQGQPSPKPKPKPPRREVPPDRRPQWPTPPVRHDEKQRPKWQAPPTRRPGYRKDENQ
jgi:hypothetical protein